MCSKQRLRIWFLLIIMPCALLTMQSQHWWNSLAVRYSSWIRYTILPQVGEVVWGGQHDAVDLRPCPDLCGHCGANHDPSCYTDYKAANLHVHHHSPVTHAWLKVEPLCRERYNSTASDRKQWSPAGNIHTIGHSWFVYIITCFVLTCVSTVLWWPLWWCVFCWYTTHEPNSMGAILFTIKLLLQTMC